MTTTNELSENQSSFLDYVQDLANQAGLSTADISSLTTGFLEGIGEINVRKGSERLQNEILDVLDGSTPALSNIDIFGNGSGTSFSDWIQTSGFISPDALSDAFSARNFGNDVLDFGRQLGYVGAITSNVYALGAAVFNGANPSELRALVIELTEDFIVGFLAGLLFGTAVTFIFGPPTLAALPFFLLADLAFGIAFTAFYNDFISPRFIVPLTDLFSQLGGTIDPLVIDLDGDGVNTTSVTVSGVTFDLDNNGTEEGVGWFEAEDGILVQDWKGGGLDENGNPIGDGEAQDRSELFATFDELSRHDLNGDGILDASDVGPQATQDTNGDGVINADDVVLPDGLEDVNGDGVIDINDIDERAQDINGDGIISDDEIDHPTVTADLDGDGELETVRVGYDQVQLWIDANQNGNVDEGELQTLAEAGIASIDLNETPLLMAA